MERVDTSQENQRNTEKRHIGMAEKRYITYYSTTTLPLSAATMYGSHASDLELHFSCWFSPSKHPHTCGIPTEHRKVSVSLILLVIAAFHQQLQIKTHI
jgi:hypothetical protein